MNDPDIRALLMAPPGRNLPGEPADEEPSWWLPYAAEFPPWHAWAGVNGQCYARKPGSSPPLVIRTGTPEDLAARIRATPLPWWMRP